LPGDHAGGFTDASRCNADSVAFTLAEPNSDSDTGSRSAEGRHSSRPLFDAIAVTGTDGLAFTVTHSDGIDLTASERNTVCYTDTVGSTGTSSFTHAVCYAHSSPLRVLFAPTKDLKTAFGRFSFAGCEQNS
jgi:hypothetical protein